MFRRLLTSCKPLYLVNISHFSVSNCRMAQKSAMVLLAEGSEEIEAVVTVDVLRRSGMKVTLAGLSGAEAHECSRQVKILPDVSLEDAIKKGPYDIVVLPGGMGGTEAFCKSAEVGALLKEQEAAGRSIAAICAAPMALKAHSIGLGKRVTAYPHESIEGDITDGGKYTLVKERVVVDGKLITSQGPGTAYEFALVILKELLGKEEADKVAGPLILPG